MLLITRQAVVDKSAVVAGAVLAGAIHLAGANAEVIKRWSNEVQEAINSRHPMVQFQASWPAYDGALGSSCCALPSAQRAASQALISLSPRADCSALPASTAYWY